MYIWKLHIKQCKIHTEASINNRLQNGGKMISQKYKDMLGAKSVIREMSAWVTKLLRKI